MQNPLNTRTGRLVTFFFLYVTEGIPLGFTATAVATQMRRQGLGPAVIGSFVASLYLPWAWKWLAGPVVDVCYSDRFGKRRLWILSCQLLMVATLMAGVMVDFRTQIGLFTAIILVHNIFGAIQDVAIDALACETLPIDERGVVNGMMFAGAYLGNGVGGAGVLFLKPYLGDFRFAFLFVGLAILMVTVFITWRLREPKTTPKEPSEEESNTDSRWHTIQKELKEYLITTGRAFFGSRLGFLGVVFALLPCGAFSLGLVLQNNLSVDIGLLDSEIAWLSFSSVILSALGCILGGRLSDRFGRRLCIGIFLASTSLPVLVLAAYLFQTDWEFSKRITETIDPDSVFQLVIMFWATCSVYSFVHGLMYGTRTALFMDICQPEIAATQFTAYMALLNVVIAYTASWQGESIERWGYATTLTLDAILGLLCLFILPFLKPTPTLDEKGERGA